MKIILILTLTITPFCSNTANAGTLRNLVEFNCASFADTVSHQFADCIDLDDTFQCMCREGYVGDGRRCTDEDECTREEFPCPSPETGGFCVNAFVYDPSAANFKGYTCGCDNIKGMDGSVVNAHGPITCEEDIDSCTDPNLNDCDANATCGNIAFGSFTCTCLDEFEGDGKTCVAAPDIMDPPTNPRIPETIVQLCPSSEVEILILTNDFESGRAIGWQQWLVDQTAQDTDFTAFLGSFDNSTTIFPYREFQVPMSTMRLMIGFDFYEIDSWDGNGANGPDTLGFEFYSETEGVTTNVNFGSFYYLDENESQSGSVGSLQWTIESSPWADSPQGFRPEFQDQKHSVMMEIGSDMYSDTGDTLRATIEWSLIGEADENVGIDNFKVVACMDTFPSMMPSAAPTITPSMNPTDEPLRHPLSGGGVDCSGVVDCFTGCNGATASCPFCQIECGPV